MLELNILGPLAIISDQRIHEIGAGRVRTILALLALSPGRPLPFDELANELWADRPLLNARNALQANVVRLRKQLEAVTGRSGDALVRTVSNGYVLDVPREAVDVYRFHRLADRGAATVDSRPAEALVDLEQALALWRGPALFDIAEGSRCRNEATRLHERRLGAQEDLITAKLAIGQTRNVLAELRQLAAQYPEHERFSEQLMVALYRNGRQVEALDVFHRARKQLASDLGLQPSPSLHRVYQAILVQDRVLG
jgi:SARP family transcriptional regulator, regulator of embCAB operon